MKLNIAQCARGGGGNEAGMCWTLLVLWKKQSPVIETFCTNSRIHRRPSYFSAYYSFLEISRMIYIFSGCAVDFLSLPHLLQQSEKERVEAAALNVPVIKQAIANDFVSTR